MWDVFWTGWLGFRILPWVCAAACYFIARGKNRRAVIWAILGFFFWIPLIVLLFLSKVEKKEAGGYQIPTVPSSSAPPPPPPPPPSPPPPPPPPITPPPTPKPETVTSEANVCPSCQMANSSGASFCAGCGHDLRQPVSPPEPKVSYCSNCGKPIPEGAHFCSECGHQVG